MTDFLDLALSRRSIRKYTENKVEKEKIDYILKAALASPSSKHLNPWEFLVVEDREILNQLADSKTYGSQMLKEAPLAIVVCVDSSTDTWQCDGSIAAMNMLLAAEDAGLGACWVHVNNRETKSGESAEQVCRSLLSIPQNLNVLCVISIGYKNEEKKKINIDKLQYDKIHYGKF